MGPHLERVLATVLSRFGEVGSVEESAAEDGVLWLDPERGRVLLWAVARWAVGALRGDSGDVVL